MTQKLAGNISPAEQEHLERAINEHPALREAWTQLESCFSPEDLANNFNRFEQNDYWEDILVVTRTGKLAPAVKPRFPLIKTLAIAAVMTGICAGSYYLLVQRNTPFFSIAGAKQKAVQLQLADGRIIQLNKKQHTIQLDAAQLFNTDQTLSFNTTGGSVTSSGWNTLTVPEGKTYAVKLSDGTEIWLNSATSLQFPFSFTGNSREVRLNGEAYVKVAQNAIQPFIIHSPNSTVQVLGTEFNINTYNPDATRLSLISGAVRLQAGNHAITVKPGMEAVYSRPEGLCTQPFDQEEVLGWRKGIHYFYNATLQEICTVLPRWYGIAVVIDHPAITGIHFTGVLNRNKPLQFFLENLNSTTAIKYYIDDNGALHFR